MDGAKAPLTSEPTSPPPTLPASPLPVTSLISPPTAPPAPPASTPVPMLPPDNPAFRPPVRPPCTKSPATSPMVSPATSDTTLPTPELIADARPDAPKPPATAPGRTDPAVMGLPVTASNAAVSPAPSNAPPPAAPMPNSPPSAAPKPKPPVANAKAAPANGIPYLSRKLLVCRVPAKRARSGAALSPAVVKLVAASLTPCEPVGAAPHKAASGFCPSTPCCFQFCPAA